MAPSAHTTETPANPDVDNGGPIVLGVRFMVTEETERDGVDFYCPATNTGTYDLTVFQTTADDDPANTGTGDPLETGSLASGDATPGEWNKITHDPITYSPGVVYTAAVRSSSGRYVSTANGLTDGLTGGGIILVDNNTDPNPPGLGTIVNGVFVEGAMAYPVSTFNASDYFIDISQAGAGLDPVDGELAGTLPLPTAAMAGVESIPGALAASLPMLTAAVEGDVSAVGSLAGTLPMLTAAIVGEAEDLDPGGLNIARIMQALADRLATIPSLNTFAFPPGALKPPAAVVGYPETITYDATYGRGMDRMRIPVVLVAGRANEQSTVARITAYANSQGTSSVKAVLESGTYTEFDVIVVAEGTFDAITIGGADYMACLFDVDIAGSGGGTP